MTKLWRLEKIKICLGRDGSSYQKLCDAKMLEVCVLKVTYIEEEELTDFAKCFCLLVSFYKV